MAEGISPQYEALEAEIERLQAEVKKHKEHPENQNLAERDIVRKSVDSLLPPIPPPSASVSAPDPQSPLTDYAQASPEEVRLQIEKLLEIAFQKGIFAAEHEANKKPPFIQDAFRDALAGRLHEELQKRGML